MNFPNSNIPSPYGPQYTGIREYDKDLAKCLEEVLNNLSKMFAVGISIADNLDKQLVSLSTSATPGTEVAVPHTLKRIPSGYFVLRQDRAGTIYDGSTAFSTTNIYLKSDVASVATIVLIF